MIKRKTILSSTGSVLNAIMNIMNQCLSTIAIVVKISILKMIEIYILILVDKYVIKKEETIVLIHVKKDVIKENVVHAILKEYK